MQPHPSLHRFQLASGWRRMLRRPSMCSPGSACCARNECADCSRRQGLVPLHVPHRLCKTLRSSLPNGPMLLLGGQLGQVVIGQTSCPCLLIFQIMVKAV